MHVPDGMTVGGSNDAGLTVGVSDVGSKMSFSLEGEGVVGGEGASVGSAASAAGATVEGAMVGEDTAGPWAWTSITEDCGAP